MPWPTLSDPIFVVGAPRSGTTLVQCILSASPGAFSLPETHFFSVVLPGLGVAPDAPLTLPVLDRIRGITTREQDLDIYRPVLDEMKNHREAGAEPRVLDVFLALVGEFRPDVGADTPPSRLVEKTPLHVLHLQQIADLFPSARFVNVVRNPLDVVSSWRSVPFAWTRSVVAYAQAWIQAVQAAESFGSRNPGRLLTLRYETLTQDPETAVTEMCAFVGLPFERRLLEQFGAEAARNVGRGETWKADVGAGVLLNREGVWRKRLTEGQGWLVSRATRGKRQQYGYGDSPRVPMTKLAEAVGEECRVRFVESRHASSLWDTVRFAASPVKLIVQSGAASPAA